MFILSININWLYFRPEAIGVLSGCVFLVTIFLFIPIVFGNGLMDRGKFPHNEVT